MRLDGAGVVVTGAAGGIGAALARRFSVAGARLMLADLDEEGLRAVAEELGAFAVPCDVAAEDDVRHLVDGARDALGEIDLYCANAGVQGPPSEQDDAAWLRTIDVNMMSHVRAARHLLPHWLARERGHLLCTVSAAGLLSMPGAAAYSVTKHGALAFAEWLAYTYGHRGITVQALCPRGVRTAMLGDDPYADAVLRRNALPVEAVVDAAIEALGTGKFLILPHADAYDAYVKRATDTDGWLAAMNRIEQRVRLQS